MLLTTSWSKNKYNKIIKASFLILCIYYLCFCCSVHYLESWGSSHYSETGFWLVYHLRRMQTSFILIFQKAYIIFFSMGASEYTITSEQIRLKSGKVRSSFDNRIFFPLNNLVFSSCGISKTVFSILLMHWTYLVLLV